MDINAHHYHHLHCFVAFSGCAVEVVKYQGCPVVSCEVVMSLGLHLILQTVQISPRCNVPMPVLFAVKIHCLWFLLVLDMFWTWTVAPSTAVYVEQDVSQFQYSLTIHYLTETALAWLNKNYQLQQYMVKL